jgi:hypothetical protein
MTRSRYWIKHGHARAGKESGVYVSYKNMHARCYNTKHPNWTCYGARGIKVCERWHVFANFLADMGERPTGLTLDRIDNSGDYEPGNCRWATRKEQGRNTRQNMMITSGCATKCLADWADFAGMSAHALRSRLLRGWTLKRAIEEPCKAYRGTFWSSRKEARLP